MDKIQDPSEVNSTSPPAKGADAPVPTPAKPPSDKDQSAWQDALKNPQASDENVKAKLQDAELEEASEEKQTDSAEDEPGVKMADIEQPLIAAENMEDIVISLMQSMMRENSFREAKQARGEAIKEGAITKNAVVGVQQDMSAKEKKTLERQAQSLGVAMLQRLNQMVPQQIVPPALQSGGVQADRIEAMIQKMVKGIQVTDRSVDQHAQVRMQLDDGFLKGAEIILAMAGPDELQIRVRHDDADVIENLAGLQNRMEEELQESLHVSMPSVRLSVRFGVQGDADNPEISN